MTDKTAIDALKVAREALKERRAYCFAWEYKYSKEWDNEDGYIQDAIEKLAAIDAEKPGEGAEECLSKMFRDIRKIGYITDPLRLTNESHDACIDLLNHFAESYHASRCKEESAAILAASNRLGAALDESDKGR